MPSESALLTRESPPWRPHSRIQSGLDLDPSLFFTRPGLRGHPVKVLQGPSWRQLDSAWKEVFAEVPLFTGLLFPPLPIPNYALLSQPLINCHS